MKISNDVLQKLIAFLSKAGFGTNKADINAIARELAEALAKAGAKPPVKEPERLMVRLLEHKPFDPSDWADHHQAYFWGILDVIGGIWFNPGADDGGDRECDELRAELDFAQDSYNDAHGAFMDCLRGHERRFGLDEPGQGDLSSGAIACGGPRGAMVEHGNALRELMFKMDRVGCSF